MWKVLASDGLDSSAKKLFDDDSHFQLSVEKGLEKAAFIEKAKNQDFLVIRSATKLDADTLKHLPNLKGVVRAGVGIDNIDLHAATEEGVYVWNAPTGNFQSTAELALALMFSLIRQIPYAHGKSREGVWSKKEIGSNARQIKGLTLGLYGAGNIGGIVAESANAFGMKVIVSDPMFSPDRMPFAQSVAFEDMLENSDVVSIHAPLLEGTKAAFNKEAFKKMKKSAYLINAARGGIVVDKDLLWALKEGAITAAAMDVFETEPFDKGADFYKELLSLSNFVATPHLGASTQEAQRLVGEECYEKLKKVISSPSDFPKAFNIPHKPRLSFENLE